MVAPWGLAGQYASRTGTPGTEVPDLALASGLVIATGVPGPVPGMRRTMARVNHSEPRSQPASSPGTSLGPTGATALSEAFDGRPGVMDRRGRALRDLRISVTDRCNFRCTYCMPAEVFGRDYAFLPHTEVLTYEEIRRLAAIAVDLGVRKLRITGGEPLVRKSLPDLIAMLAVLRAPDGAAADLTLTTNGSALRGLARPLADAGLRRITVSLDSLDDATFRRMNGVDFPVSRVLDGIAAAREAGLDPIKVNMVVKRGENEDSVVPMARWARAEGLVLRYIEYMDVGTANGWRLDDVVSAADIVGMIDGEMPLEPVAATYRGEVANRWGYRDGSGEIGVIASVSQPFCGDCTRARRSAEGKLYTCLFSATGTDLRGPLRDGASDEDVRAILERVWNDRTDQYSELRTEATSHLPRVEMFVIHHSSTGVENSWTGSAAPNRSSWINALPGRTGGGYIQSCPKGPSGDEGTEITSRGPCSGPVASGASLPGRDEPPCSSPGWSPGGT
ncbi:MAG: moaA [Chloroflexi bacterium]|nr:moaA [Chloroflexota bacterium]